MSNINGIKACLLLEHAFSWLATLLEVALWAICPIVQAPILNPTSGETPSGWHMHASLTVHQNICRPKCRPALLWVSLIVYRRLFLHIYSRAVQIYEKGHPQQIHTCIWGLEAPYTKLRAPPKVSRHALRPTGQTWNNGIMRRYLRIVQYSIGDICWPKSSIGIARRKSLSMCCLQTPKNRFLLGVHVKLYFHVPNTFTKKGHSPKHVGI